MNRGLVTNIVCTALIAFGVNGVAMAETGLTLPENACLVESYEWHDADTPKRCRVRLPWGVILDEPEGIRDDGYDAWELGNRGGAGVTDAERLKGRKALDELQVLSVGKSLYVVPYARGKRDSFGRLLGSLYLVGGDGKAIRLKDWATQNGHVRVPQRGNAAQKGGDP